MGRTNIDIDDDLIRKVMTRYGFATMKEAVNASLLAMASDAMTLDEALGMRGAGWDGDLEAMRTSRVTDGS